MGRPMSNYVAEWQDLGNNNAPGLSLPNKLHTSKKQGGSNSCRFRNASRTIKQAGQIKQVAELIVMGDDGFVSFR